MTHSTGWTAARTQASYDTVVLGAGSMGLSTADALTKQGQTVLLLDRYDPPHAFGSHHGDTRLFRMAYAEGAAYIPLLQDARRRWLDLEHRAQALGLPYRPGDLFAPIGVINVSRESGALAKEVQDSIDAYALPCERLDAQEAMSRWPGLSLADDGVVYLDSQGGVLFPQACLTVYKEACLAQGAKVMVGQGRVWVDPVSLDISIDWNGEHFAAKNLVVTAGAGAKDVLDSQLGLSLPLQVTRKTVAWFRPRAGTAPSRSVPPALPNSLYEAPLFPGFLAESEQGTFYGFPDFGDGVKLGRHDGGTPCTLETVDRDFASDPRDERELRSFLESFLPQAAGRLERGSVCLYTMTPDEHFVIDYHPRYDNVVIATGFSGHGFKFASVVGEVVGRMVTHVDAGCDLSLFQAKRLTGNMDDQE